MQTLGSILVNTTHCIYKSRMISKMINNVKFQKILCKHHVRENIDDMSTSNTYHELFSKRPKSLLIKYNLAEVLTYYFL